MKRSVLKFILAALCLPLTVGCAANVQSNAAAESEAAQPLTLDTYGCLYTLAQLQEDPLIRFDDAPVMTHEGDEWYHEVKVIYHAGGGIDGKSYTNSVEAMEATLAAGNRVIELDFLYTADDRLVCAHSWNVFKAEQPLLFADMMAVGVYRKYTPLTAEQVIGYMRQYPELRIVQDMKDDDKIRALEDLIDLSGEEDAVLSRLIIQLYAPGMKAQVLQLYPFPEESFLFTAYLFGPERVTEILWLCYEEQIKVVTVPFGSWSQQTVDYFRHKDIYVYEHTVNTQADAQDAISRGVHGVYTDFLQPWQVNTLLR